MNSSSQLPQMSAANHQKNKNANQNIQAYVRVRPHFKHVTRGKPPKSLIANITNQNEKKNSKLESTKPKQNFGGNEGPLNAREKGLRSIEVVESATSKEILIRHQFDSKMMKKFTFDRVFGQDSKQCEIYQTVVSPLIDEVLAGYNCTVFAYGQTGTGKTHTMVGTETHEIQTSWDNESLIGIIPRAISHLLDELRLLELEFTMRISYLELYNEELCDLLSSDDNAKNVRIFEDSNKKGSIIIQGLEEVIVNNKNDVYKLLEKGTERRKTATTLMNAQSSRSHTIFTILVHIKENGIDGEEMLKIGKLNLVDLAGSENISKSGNEKGIRTRETVNINQSLLTLGRVITALVERTPHIPYRESKLTRLLQESLGGRTKTSIIATISPGNKDIEETLSTLEYAHRAKNIQNRPEVNQKLTKKTVLKEYTEQIDRLKRELMSARDKNGIYLPEDTYNDMHYKIENQIKELNEKMMIIKALKEEKENKEKAFNEVSLNLVEKAEKLLKTESNLIDTKFKLDQTERYLNTTKRRYKEKKIVLSNHIKTEEELTNQAKQLLEVADLATSDHIHLQNTLERRKNADDDIKNTCDVFVNKLKKKFYDFNIYFNDFNESQSQLLLDVNCNLTKSKNNNNAFVESIRNGLTDILKTQESNNNEIISKCESNCNSFKEFLEPLLNEQSKIENERCKLVVTKINQLLIHSNTFNRVQTEKSEDFFQKTSKISLMAKDFYAYASNFNKKYEQIFQTFKNELFQKIENLSRVAEKRKTKLSEIDNLIKNLNCLEDDECVELSNTKNILNKYSEDFTDNSTNTTQLLKDYEKKNEINVNDINTSERIFTSKLETDLQLLNNSLTIHCNEVTDANEQLTDFVKVIEKKTIEMKTNLVDNITETLVLSENKNDLNKLFDKIENHVECSQILEDQAYSLCTNTQKKMLDISEKHNFALNEWENDLDNFNQNDLKIYTPTGQTPSKKDFSYPRVLSQTSPPEIIIKRFRLEKEWSDADISNVTITEENEELINEPEYISQLEPLRRSNSVPQINETSTLISKSYLTEKGNTSDGGIIIKKNTKTLSIFNDDNKENFC